MEKSCILNGSNATHSGGKDTPAPDSAVETPVQAGSNSMISENYTLDSCNEIENNSKDSICTSLISATQGSVENCHKRKDENQDEAETLELLELLGNDEPHCGDNNTTNELSLQPERTVSVKILEGHEEIPGNGSLDVNKRTEINTIFASVTKFSDISEVMQRESELNINGFKCVPVEIAEVVVRTDNEIHDSLTEKNPESRKRDENLKKFGDSTDDDAYEADEEISETCSSVGSIRETLE